MRNFQHTMIFFAATLCACVIDPTDDDDAGGNTDTAATEPGTSNVSNSEGESSQEGGTSNSTNPATSDPDDSSDSGPPDTDTGAGEGMFCTYECQVTEDCYVMGMDAGLMCEGNRCVGEGTVEGCTTNEECVAQLSGWSFGTACTAEADCAALMQHCVDIGGGEGHCAMAPSEFIMCETSGFEEIMMNNIEGDPVTVCGNPNAECNDLGYCFSPCQGNEDCPESAPNCDTTTGTCSCSENAHCETIGEPSTSVCLDTGTCGCDSDDDCDAAIGDVCTDFGTCGCSNDEACADLMNPYDGATIICAGV